jgi:cytochrome oxidase assembly protein ShyY1
MIHYCFASPALFIVLFWDPNKKACKISHFTIIFTNDYLEYTMPWISIAAFSASLLAYSSVLPSYVASMILGLLG